MKHSFAIIVAVILFATHVWASADLVKQKAKAIRDNNNVQQGIVAPAPSAPGVAPAAPSGPQGMSSSQQQLVDKVKADFSGLSTVTNSTANQQLGLQTDILDLGKSTRPTKSLVGKLSVDMSTALVGKTLPPSDLAQLAKDVNIVMNSAPLTPDRTQTFVNEAQMILKSHGISEDSAKTIAADLKAMLLDIQHNKPKLY